MNKPVQTRLSDKKGDTGFGVLSSLCLHHNHPECTGNVPLGVRSRQLEEEHLQGEPVHQGGTHHAPPCLVAAGLKDIYFALTTSLSTEHTPLLCSPGSVQLWASPVQDWRVASPLSLGSMETHPTDV